MPRRHPKPEPARASSSESSRFRQERRAERRSRKSSEDSRDRLLTQAERDLLEQERIGADSSQQKHIDTELAADLLSKPEPARRERAG